MSEPVKKSYPIGAIVSADLTIPNAGELKDFYTQVIGWSAEELKMGDEEEYADYIMKDAGGNWAGGVCHAKGINSNIPPVWMVYINVASVGETVEKCKALGGKVIKEAFDGNGHYIYAMLEDPMGTVLAVNHAVE